MTGFPPVKGLANNNSDLEAHNHVDSDNPLVCDDFFRRASSASRKKVDNKLHDNKN
jgi:hypothetical protein